MTQQTIHTPYEEMLAHILEKGQPRNDRTGIGTRSIFGTQMCYNLQAGYPLITTKKIHFKSVAIELLWMLRGDTNTKYLNDHGVTIWDEWANEDGDLGPIYGKQWRQWQGSHFTWPIDQISKAIHTINTDPTSRRIVISAWNTADLPEMALLPCHILCQFHITGTRLSCHVYQRSADMFLGVPFNIASYALLTHMFAAQTGYQPGDLVWTGGDCHIYNNHLDQVAEQLTREPRPYPTLTLTPRDNIFDYTYQDIHIHNYQPHPAIKAEVAI